MLINAGTCVGIIYKPNPNAAGWFVHNGKLKENINTNKLPSSIHAYHWTRNQKGQPILGCLKFTGSQVVAIIKTRFNTKVCSSAIPSKGSIIRPGACIGIWFRKGNTRDIKNGRFLYWVDQTGKIRCALDTSKVKPSQIREVYYQHLNFNKSCLCFRQEKTFRGKSNGETILGVFRTVPVPNRCK